MRRHIPAQSDWSKPNFYRSDLKVIKGKAARNIFSNKTGKIVTNDLYTRWKSPISKETFDELVKKDVLSEEQIAHYLQIKESDARKYKSMTAEEHNDFDLTVEISKLDLETKKGMAAFTKLIKKRPEAVRLIGAALELKANK